MMTRVQIIATIWNYLKDIEFQANFDDTASKRTMDILATKVRVYLEVLEDEDIPYDMALLMSKLHIN